MDKPLIYLILGVTGSDRRALVLDLIENGLTETDRPAVLLNARETPDAVDAKLPNLSRWTWMENSIEAGLPVDATHIFFVSDGRSNPIDQIEALKPWLDQVGAELGRIIFVANCQFIEANPPLLAWCDACVHFSDVVLLNHREGVANKWMSDFQGRYKNQFMPLLFEFVKAGRLKNTATVLDPVARRIAHLFDDEPNWIISGGDDEDEAEGNEEVEAAPEEDPYLARHSGGRRLKEIPDIEKFLPPVE
jgi:hypothetical protein|uniref:hypothetical protein n=1 Tax=Cephaloticoccus sp. TaxID=1985742 RepID=UPI004049B980